MEQPQGFHDNGHIDYVCCLHKAIYGLKQAPHAWFPRLSSFLLELGFQASLVDTSLFIFISGTIQIYMLVYVDYIILIGTHISAQNLLISQMHKSFLLRIWVLLVSSWEFRLHVAPMACISVKRSI
jgi:hypothetical protein